MLPVAETGDAGHLTLDFFTFGPIFVDTLVLSRSQFSELTGPVTVDTLNRDNCDVHSLRQVPGFRPKAGHFWPQNLKMR
jgi:hypothetical protein